MDDEQHYDWGNDGDEEWLRWDSAKEKRYNCAGKDDESPFRKQKVENRETNYNAECVSATPVRYNPIEGA